jgi:hypothetical protein
MSDLQSLLKKLNASPVSTQSYVYYIKEVRLIFPKKTLLFLKLTMS